MVRTGTFFEVTLYSMHVYGTKGHSVMGDCQHDKNIFGQKLFFDTFWSIFFPKINLNQNFYKTHPRVLKMNSVNLALFRFYSKLLF